MSFGSYIALGVAARMLVVLGVVGFIGFGLVSLIGWLLL